MDVPGKDRGNGLGIQDPGFEHRPRPGPAFFRRLKDEEDFAGPLFRPATFHQRPRDAKEDGHMGIVAGGMHDTGVLGAIWNVVLFIERQGVHVGAHGDGWAGFCRGEAGDDTGPADLVPAETPTWRSTSTIFAAVFSSR